MKLPKIVRKAFFNIIEQRFQINVDKVNVNESYPKLQISETLIVHDKLDPVVSFKNAQDIYEHWDNATLVTLEGYGHYRLMKNPDLIERVAAFMD